MKKAKATHGILELQELRLPMARVIDDPEILLQEQRKLRSEAGSAQEENNETLSLATDDDSGNIVTEVYLAIDDKPCSLVEDTETAARNQAKQKVKSQATYIDLEEQNKIESIQIEQKTEKLLKEMKNVSCIFQTETVEYSMKQEKKKLPKEMNNISCMFQSETMEHSIKPETENLPMKMRNAKFMFQTNTMKHSKIQNKAEVELLGKGDVPLVDVVNLVSIGSVDEEETSHGIFSIGDKTKTELSGLATVAAATKKTEQINKMDTELFCKINTGTQIVKTELKAARLEIAAEVDLELIGKKDTESSVKVKLGPVNNIDEKVAAMNATKQSKQTSTHKFGNPSPGSSKNIPHAKTLREFAKILPTYVLTPEILTPILYPKMISDGIFVCPKEKSPEEERKPCDCLPDVEIEGEDEVKGLNFICPRRCQMKGTTDDLPESEKVFDKKKLNKKEEEGTPKVKRHLKRKQKQTKPRSRNAIIQQESNEDFLPFSASGKKAEQYDLFTGMFEDGVRRVDYVLVVEPSDNPDVEEIKYNYLSGLAKMGMQIEVVAGELPKNKNLQFVKLHATDLLLATYAESFGAQKFFKDNHTQYISHQDTWIKKIFGIKYEREMLRTVRRHDIRPLRFTMVERSYIVFMLLRHASFGEPANYFGLHRLLENKIIKDAYALHDGPYFVPDDKTFTTYNCRQALYLNWVGITNMFTYQPLNLIHEYFGSKLAFYFAFYEFYNKALVYASLWGVLVNIIYLFKDKEYFQFARQEICTYDLRSTFDMVKSSHMTFCPECHLTKTNTTCVVTMGQDYCFDLAFMKFYDNPYIILFSFGIAFWALMFLRMWKRTQCYWNWMWEEYYTANRLVVRYESGVLRGKPKAYGVQKSCMEFLINFGKIIWFRGIPNTILPLNVLLIISSVLFSDFEFYNLFRPLTLTSIIDTNTKKLYLPELDPKLNWGLFSVEVLIVSIIFFVLKKLIIKTSLTVTNLERHRLQEHYEQAIILKYFFYGFLFTSIWTIYFSWIKGAFDSNPLYGWETIFKIKTPWKTYDVNMSAQPELFKNVTQRIISQNCNPFSCLRQGAFVYNTYIAMEVVYFKLVTFLVSAMKREPRPYQQPVSTVEREYMLKPVTEHRIQCDFTELFIQVAMVILFSPLFPQAPLFALFINSLDIRHKAKSYLILSRRAVLFKSMGIGYWNMITKLICYSVPLFHGMTIIRTEALKRYMFYKHLPSNNETIIYSMTRDFGGSPMNYKSPDELFWGYILRDNFDLSKLVDYGPGYTDSLKQPVSTASSCDCIVNFRLLRLYASRTAMNKDFSNPTNFISSKIELANSDATPLPDHYYLEFIKVVLIMVYVYLVGILALLLWRYWRGCPAGVARLMQRERTITRLRAHTLYFFDAKKVDLKLDK